MFISFSQLFKYDFILQLHNCGLYKANTSSSINNYFQSWFHKRIFALKKYMSFEHSSVTLTVITHPVPKACCIINHRLHMSWQCWRGTKSTVASELHSIPDRCWWLLNQLWLPLGSRRCVSVCVFLLVPRMCVHVNTFCGIQGYFKCVFITICDEIARHSLGLDLVWKVPSAYPAGSVSPPLAVTSTARHRVICILALSSSGWGHLFQNAHMGAAQFIIFMIVVMPTPCGK